MHDQPYAGDEKSPRKTLSHSGKASSNFSRLRSFPWEGEANNFEGFDPGSERTLAAWIRHASRTNPHLGNWVGGSGERGSKAWVTYPRDGHSHSNEWVILGDMVGGHPLAIKRVSPGEGLMWYYLVGGVTAHQGKDA